MVGHVDGTSSRNQAPCGSKNGYVNRKGFHCINVQGIIVVTLNIASLKSTIILTLEAQFAFAHSFFGYDAA